MDILKQLSAESLDVFAQVSYRWHYFLGIMNEKGVSPIRKRPSARASPPAKRAKIIEIEEAPTGVKREDPMILQALRRVLRDDRGQFRSAQ